MNNPGPGKIFICFALFLLACGEGGKEPRKVSEDKKASAAPSPAGAGAEPASKKRSRANRFVLDNGMVAVVMKQSNLPFVVVKMSFKAGSIYDPPKKAGTASLAADLLTEGTRSRTSQEISQAIDFVGGRLGSGADVDFANLNLIVLKKDIEVGMELLADIILNPVFDAEEVKRQREQVIASLIDEKDDPGTVAAKAINKLIYRDHPYRYPAKGALETVPDITREDLIAFHRKHYLPNNAVFVTVGDIDETETRRLINKYLGQWQRAPLSLQESKAPEQNKEKLAQMIHKDLTQATVLLGHLGIRRDNPDYYAVQIMNYILGGGGFASRMMSNVRDEQGLVYGIYSYFASAGHAGSFKVFAQTKNENANRVIESVVHEIERIRTELVSEKEIKDAKAYLTGSFPLKLDTNTKVAGLLMKIENFNLGYGYFDKYPEYLNAVTREKVLQVAEKYLHPDRYCLVVVADQKKAAVKIEGRLVSEVRK